MKQSKHFVYFAQFDDFMQFSVFYSILTLLFKMIVRQPWVLVMLNKYDSVM